MKDEANVVHSGIVFIFPSTYVGVEQYMCHQMRENKLTSNWIEHVNFFLPIMCNRNWPEIKLELLRRQIQQDRLELTVRLFMKRVQSMISYKIHDKCAEDVAACLPEVELQTGDLLHSHFIFSLEWQSKQLLKHPEDVEKTNSAGSQSVHGHEHWEVVLNHSIHKPGCHFSYLAPPTVYNKEGIWQKYFQKEWVIETFDVKGLYDWHMSSILLLQEADR